MKIVQNVDTNLIEIQPKFYPPPPPLHNSLRNMMKLQNIIDLLHNMMQLCKMQLIGIFL